MIHVFFTNKFVINAKAVTELKSSIKIIWAHLITMILNTSVMVFSLEMFDNYWFTWADFKAVSFDAFAKEDLDCFLVTDSNMRFHCDAISVPEFI